MEHKPCGPAQRPGEPPPTTRVQGRVRPEGRRCTRPGPTPRPAGTVRAAAPPGGGGGEKARLPAPAQCACSRPGAVRPLRMLAAPPKLVLVQVVDGQRLPPLGQNLLLLLPLRLPLPASPLRLRGVARRGGGCWLQSASRPSPSPTETPRGAAGAHPRPPAAPPSAARIPGETEAPSPSPHRTPAPLCGLPPPRPGSCQPQGRFRTHLRLRSGTPRGRDPESETEAAAGGGGRHRGRAVSPILTGGRPRSRHPSLGGRPRSVGPSLGGRERGPAERLA